MGNGHAGVRGYTGSSTLLFAQPRGPWQSPPPPWLFFFSFLSQWIRGTLSPSLLIFTILTFLLSSQCLSHSEEIRLIFLAFIPAHSYLSKDQPFPSWGPQLSLWPQ